jgi:enamine deaminase RidA (YjgF/YER057c/UK114 family)
MSVEKLKKLGITLPKQSLPAANYKPFMISGNLVFISGQVCRWEGEMKFKGKAGQEQSVEQAKEAAKICCQNLLYHLNTACEDDLDRVTRCIKLNVYVNATKDFTEQATVANGASDLLIALFGENGQHARAAVGVNSLPSNATVEVEGIFEIKI